jgi:hypothetical protein
MATIDIGAKARSLNQSIEIERGYKERNKKIKLQRKCKSRTPTEEKVHSWKNKRKKTV